MSPTIPRRWRAAFLLALAAAPLAAQQPAAPHAPRTLSLDDALAIAAKESEALRIAQAGVLRADGQMLQARSGMLPQLNATANYQRTIQSQFVEITNRLGSGTSSGTGGSGSGSSSTSAANPITKIFASPNNVVLGLTATQTLWAAGRVRAQTGAALAGRRAAERGLTTATAQLQYDVAQAYFDAIVADRLAAIADSSLQQAERSLQQTTVARQVGTSAEFDLLRARVARDNLRPQLFAAQSQQEAAYARLASLLNIPFDQPIQLTSNIAEPDTTVVAASLAAAFDGRDVARPVVFRPITPATSDSAAAARTAVQALADNVVATRNLYSAAKAQRLPALQLSSSYQRFAYPDDAGQGWGFFFPNWTASVGLSLPIFTGGRITGDVDIARANLIEAEQRLQQAKEGAAIEARLALNDLRQAQAAYVSNVGTDVQAARAYQIAEVRYTEGVSTQLELIEARNQLSQARANRAVAARNLALAELKLKLLKDLPVGAGTTQGGMTTGAPSAGSTTGGATQAAPRPQTTGTPTGGAQASVSGPTN